MLDSWWPKWHWAIPSGRSLRCRSAATHLLRLWVEIPLGAWMSVCWVLSGRGLCDELITCPDESYWLCCIIVCDLETSWMRRPWPTVGAVVPPPPKKKLWRWGTFSPHTLVFLCHLQCHQCFICMWGRYIGPLAHAVPRWFIWFHPNNSNSSSSSDDMKMMTTKITPPPPLPPPPPHCHYHHHPTTTTTTTTANTITTTAPHVFKLKCYVCFLSPSFNYIFNHLEWRECMWNCNSDLWLGYLKL